MMPGERYNLRYVDHTILMADNEVELKSFLMKVKEESEKSCLKLNFKKTKVMSYGPITSWKISGETMVIVTDVFFSGSQFTVDSDCSHEIKRCLLLLKKSYDKSRQNSRKQRHHLANKGPLVKAMDFPAVVYGCESWTIKNAECLCTTAFLSIHLLMNI